MAIHLGLHLKLEQTWVTLCEVRRMDPRAQCLNGSKDKKKQNCQVSNWNICICILQAGGTYTKDGSPQSFGLQTGGSLTFPLECGTYWEGSVEGGP